MKKLLLISLFLVGIYVNAQVWEQGIVTGPMTTTEINAIVSPTEGRQVYNETTKTIWLFDGTQWVDTEEGGTDYTFSTGLTNDNGTVSVTNPFTPNTFLPLAGGIMSGTLDSDGNDIIDVGSMSGTTLGFATVSASSLLSSFYIKANPIPVPSNTDNGVFYYDSDINKFQFRENGSWVTYGSGGGMDWSTPVNADIIPDTDTAYDIGNSGSGEFNNIYANEFHGGSFIGTGVFSNTSSGTYRSGVTTDINPNDYDEGTWFWNRTTNKLRLQVEGLSFENIAYESQLSTAGTDDQNASEVPITDSGSYFTSTDVEGALQELGSGNSSLSDADQTISGGTQRIIYLKETAAQSAGGLSIQNSPEQSNPMMTIKQDSTRFYHGVNMKNFGITDLADPVNDQDAATKAYVDSSGGGGGTDDQNADEVPYTRNSQTTTGGALDNLYTTKTTQGGVGTFSQLTSLGVSFLNNQDVYLSGDSTTDKTVIDEDANVADQSVLHFDVGTATPIALKATPTDLFYNEVSLTQGGSSYLNPDLNFAARNGDATVTNEWAVVTGKEDEKTFNENTTANDYIYTVDNTFTSAKLAIVKQDHPQGNMIFVPGSGYSIESNGTEYVQTDSTGHLGVYIDSANVGSFYRKGDVFKFDSYFKPYTLGIAQNLSSPSNTTTSIDLTWSDPLIDVGINGYYLSVNDGVNTDIGYVLSHTVTGLSDGTSYDFKVQPYDSAGNVGAYTSNLNVSTATANNELYTVGNWLSRVPNEADSNTSLGVNGAILTREDTFVGEGLYAVRIESGDGSSDRMEINLSLTANSDFILKYWGATDGTNTIATSSWVGFSTKGSQIATGNTNNGMTEYQIPITTDGTGSQLLRFYSNGSAGNFVYIGGLSIKSDI